MTGADFGREIRRLADELRAVASLGERWSAESYYDLDRYRHVKRLAAELFALTDERPPDEIERTVFRELTHIAPLPTGDAAVIDDSGRMLLIRRADDGLWAMPGGALEMGEAPATGVCREALEEAGVEAEPVALAGIFDSRLHDTKATLQLYMFVFLCRPTGRVAEPSTPWEVLDVDWFAEEDLPPLSGGHTVRVPHAFAFWRGDTGPYFDLLG